MTKFGFAVGSGSFVRGLNLRLLSFNICGKSSRHFFLTSDLIHPFAICYDLFRPFFYTLCLHQRSPFLQTSRYRYHRIFICIPTIPQYHALSVTVIEIYDSIIDGTFDRAFCPFPGNLPDIG